MSPFNATVEEVVPVLQPGIYDAVFSKIEEQSNDNGTFWMWTFTARDGSNDVEITATTSPRITPKTKAAKWLSGLGIVAEVGVNIDFESLYDTPCRIVVIINDAGYSRIDGVIPIAPKKVK